MVQGEKRPLTGFGFGPTTKERAFIPVAEGSNPSSAPVGALDNSKQPQSTFIRKADAVLKDELISRESQDNGGLTSHILSGSHDVESTAEALVSQPKKAFDKFMEVENYPPEQLTQIATPFTSMGGLKESDENLPLLKVLSPIDPGQTGHIDFTLINDNAKETVEYTLYTTGLVGLTGHRISEAHITVSPNPGKVPPGESVDGCIDICVPAGTPQGTYGGLLQAEDISQLQAVVQIIVGP